MMLSSIFLLSLPFIAQAELDRRDDTSEGGGDPNSGSNPSGNGLSNWVGNPNQQPIEPLKDQFYTKVPTNLTKYSNGQIIGQRSIGVSGTYQGVDSSYQIRLRSEDAHDSAALTLASVLIPRQSNSNGDIVVYQIPEDAVAIDCAPTYQLFGRNVVPEIQDLIDQGFTVVVPDYEGQRGSFTVGKLAGKQILDSARAALSLEEVKDSNHTVNIGIWGYGTAAHASGWAAELASSYAPELPLKAVALGGLITNLQSWIEAVNNSPSAGSVISSLLGMATEYKDISDALADNVIPRRRSQFQSAASRCSGFNLIHYFNANVTSEFFTPGIDVFSIPKVQSVYALNSLGKSSPKVDMYVYQGTDDTVASAGEVHSLLKSYCANGTSVRYHEIPGASHSQARNQYSEVIDYFSNVLSGTAPPSSCQRITNGDFYMS